MAKDATTKHHWLRNINNRFIFSHNYGGWKAKIQQGWILGKILLTDSCFLLCPHKAERGRFRERGLPILIRLGPTLRPHLTLITSSGPYLQRYSNLNIWGSVQFSHSVVSDSSWPHESQHVRPPYPSPTPGVQSNPCPSSRWCHPAISSSVVPFSSCPQSLPASEPFPMSQLFIWGGQSIVVSALASVLPKNTQDWSPLGWIGWISLQSKGFSRGFSI